MPRLERRDQTRPARRTVTCFCFADRLKSVSSNPPKRRGRQRYKTLGAAMAPIAVFYFAVFYYVAFGFLHLAKTTFAAFEVFGSGSATATLAIQDSVLDDKLATTKDRYSNNDSRSLRADMTPRQPGSQCHASYLLLLWFFCDGFPERRAPPPPPPGAPRPAEVAVWSSGPTGKVPARMQSFAVHPNTKHASTAPKLWPGPAVVSPEHTICVEP